MGKKGGLAISFDLENSKFLFVTVHLTHRQNEIEERNASLNRLNEELLPS